MATAKIVLFKGKKLADGKHPVMIRLSEYSKKAFIRIGNYSATPEEWNAGLSRFNENVKGFKNKNDKLHKIEKNVDDILNDLTAMQIFSFETFKQHYFKSDKKLSVGEAYNKKIDELDASNKIGTSLQYAYSLKVIIHEFNKGIDLPFSAITTEFLKKFELSRKKKGNSGNTISNILRPLRALYNVYLRQNHLPPSISPFQGEGSFGIKELEEEPRKKALTFDQMHQLINIETIPGTYLHFSKTMFLFSFYTRGMNLMDIAHLRKTDIFNGKIQYKRAKTNNRFIIGLIPQVKTILSEFNEPKYLFPILEQKKKMTALEVKKRVKGTNRNINRKLEELGKKIGVEGLSFNWARHTWATLAKRKGYSIEKISEGLGHSDIKTTNIYLDSFGSDEIDEITQNLI